MPFAEKATGTACLLRLFLRKRETLWGSIDSRHEVCVSLSVPYLANAAHGAGENHDERSGSERLEVLSRPLVGVVDDAQLARQPSRCLVVVCICADISYRRRHVT